MPEALDFIKLAYSKNIYLSIVSNKSGDFLREEVDILGIGKYFKTIIGAMDAESDKPSIAPMLLAMKDSGITINKDIWYIGDNIGDMDFANNIGCTKIFYGCDFNDSIKIKYNDVTHFNDYHNLINYLKKIANYQNF
jgi:phosphoglycolate phosphatase